MIQWYKKVVLENYANFEGRARRAEYWWFFLGHFIIAVVFGFICGLIEMPMLANVYTLAVLVPIIAVTIRRMHDVGKSGWYCLIPIYSLILACTEGEKGENQYGSDPKNENDEINQIGTNE